MFFPTQVLPSDPTGELEKLKSFIKENADICKWVGITLLVVQVSIIPKLQCFLVCFC